MIEGIGKDIEARKEGGGDSFGFDEDGQGEEEGKDEGFKEIKINDQNRFKRSSTKIVRL